MFVLSFNVIKTLSFVHCIQGESFKSVMAVITFEYSCLPCFMSAYLLIYGLELCNSFESLLTVGAQSLKIRGLEF